MDSQMFETCFLKMACEPVFLLLTLAFLLLHPVQATTCQGDNCPTGLIITGGETDERNGGTRRSIETFPNVTCTIPPFPQGRRSHTLSVVENGQKLIVCGGGWTDTWTSCISWRRGQANWTHYATLSQERSLHAAVVLPTTGEDKIFLVGGRRGSSNTSEIVNGGDTRLTLQNGGEGMCALPFNTGFVTIGGGVDRVTHGKVDRYDSEGKYLGSLPDLATHRAFHACTSFLTNSGKKALLVAGGYNGEQLSTTEIYLPSTNEWTTGGNLPRVMYGLRAGHLNQQAVVTGGREDRGTNEYTRDEVLQFNVEAGAWTKIGSLQKGRYSHAIAEVNLAALGCIGNLNPVKKEN